MRLTFIHPAIGHRAGESYIRTWQMESLPVANLTGLTPPDVELAFFDDRMEAIPFDAPTDAVAIPVETYTAARAYQLGIVSQVVDPPGQLRAEAQALAEKIARNSPAAMAATKRALWGALEAGLSEACLAGGQHLAGMWGHPDQTEGPLAFAERRDAAWQQT